MYLEHFERIVVQLSQSLLYSLVGPTHEHNSLPILVISVTGAWVDLFKYSSWIFGI